MTYSISIKQSAAKALAKIDREQRQRLIEAIDRLKDSLAAGSVLKGEFTGLRRIRVGDYRIIYETHEQRLIILVIRIGHRREIYR